MVKQNKAKLSKSKWVFLLNVIASGVGADSYWSPSSLAITIGMAIREASWFLGKQAFSLFMAEQRNESRRWFEEKKSVFSSAAEGTVENYHSWMVGTWLFLLLRWPIRADIYALGCKGTFTRTNNDAECMKVVAFFFKSWFVFATWPRFPHPNCKLGQNIAPCTKAHTNMSFS